MMRVLLIVSVLSADASCSRERATQQRDDTSLPPAPPQDAQTSKPASFDAAPSDAAKSILPRNLQSTDEPMPVVPLENECGDKRSIQPPKLPWPTATPSGAAFVSVWCETPDAAPNGAYVAWHTTGKKAAVGHRRGVRPDGAWLYFYPSGERLLAGSYQLGEPGGLWRVYDRKGTVLEVGCFDAGQKRWSSDVATGQDKRCP